MKIRCALFLPAVLFAATAVAADYIDTAPVVSSTPIYEKIVEPKQECWSESASAPAQAAPERGIAAPILGGAAGALLGSQVGRGRGRDAAAATGAVAGAVAGDRIANPNSPSSTTGAVIGGVAGALLGHQVGSGRGRTAATAAGAVAGTMVGDRLATPSAPAAQPAQIQRCRTVETTREVVKGYRVVYRYSGRDIATTLGYDPGPVVRVGVAAIDAAPAAQAGGAASSRPETPEHQGVRTGGPAGSHHH